jgi:hypothetical protein
MIPLAAILSIGEKVLDKFIPDPEAKARAIFELKKMEQDGRLAELNADNIEAQELTKLIFILLTYTVFGLMSAWEIEVNQAYVELLGQWGMLIMSFYFGGRTLEKILAMKEKK